MLDKAKFIWGSVLWSINQSTESLTRLLSCFSRIVGPALKPIFSPLKKCWTRIVCVAESSRYTYPGLFLLLQWMRKTTSWNTELSSIFTLTLNQSLIFQNHLRLLLIIKIDSRTWSFCLCHYVQNSQFSCAKVAWFCTKWLFTSKFRIIFVSIRNQFCTKMHIHSK